MAMFDLTNTIAILSFFITSVTPLYQCPLLNHFQPKKNDNRVGKHYQFRKLKLSRTDNDNEIDLTDEGPPLTESMTLPMPPMKSDTAGSEVLTLDGRLLCASQCAYSIDKSQPYFQGVAYTPGSVAKRISRGVNSVFMGRSVDGIVVSFRGTQVKNPLDWLQNAGVLLRSAPRLPGKIHSGFYKAVDSIWMPLIREVKEMLALSDRKDIYFTGHSKGGAMASIAAMLFYLDSSLPNVTHVSTFASPKVGNSEFRNAFNQVVNQTSYEGYLDLIPFLPPSASTMEMMKDQDMIQMVDDLLWSKEYQNKKKQFVWDYQTVGKRYYINENANIETNVTKYLDEKRIRDIEQKTFLSLNEFVAAHCSSCPDDENGCNGYYFRAIAKEVCLVKKSQSD